MNNIKFRILQVIVFMMVAIASFGCRSSGVNLNPAMPSGTATSPQAAFLPFFGQDPMPGTGATEPNGFAEYSNEPEPSGVSTTPIDINPPATRVTSNLNLYASTPGRRYDTASNVPLAVSEDSLLTGGTTPSGTRPSGQHLDIRPRNNPEAADLLDHWGHRRSQALVDGFSLNAPAAGSDAVDLLTIRAAAEKHSKILLAPNFQDGDEVRLLGTRQGVTYGRWAGGPADTLSIDFDLSGPGPLLVDDPVFNAMLERAGKAWSHRIADTWTPWERPPGELKGLLTGANPPVEVRVGPEGEISTGLDIDVVVWRGLPSPGWARQGARASNEIWEPHFGSIEFASNSFSGITEVHQFSTLTHEIGHVLGAWTVFSSHPEHITSYVDLTAGTWSGPNVVALHGGPAPYQDASDTHKWVNGERDPNATAFDFGHSGVCASLMAYCNDQAAVPAFLPHAIDFAFLADLGMTITEETDRPETYGLAGWTDYAAFTVSVSRQLQIALADPLSRYGYGRGPWQALEVVDLLQAEVDAFGYLSTGNFRLSHSAKGLNGTVSYAGGLLGAALDYTGLPPATGDATLSVNLATLDGTASFTSLKVYPEGTPQAFTDGSLYYSIELSANTIVGTDPDVTFQADFYGPKHEDIAGVLHDPRAGLLASFGGTIDERPSWEDVIASGDYLDGESAQYGSTDPSNDGRNYYYCGAGAICETWNRTLGSWVTETRESVFAATTGWTSRNAARLDSDHGFVRIVRHSSTTTDGAQGRHIFDGYTGTLEYASFWTGFENYSNWTIEPNAAPPYTSAFWSGFQGTLSGSPPSNRARWSGLILGLTQIAPQGTSQLIEGRVNVNYWLSTRLVDVEILEITNRDGQRVFPYFKIEGIGLEDDGVFRGGNESGSVSGAFFGPAHEEVAGKVSHFETYFDGSFGARRVEHTATPEVGSSPAIQVPIVAYGDALYIGTNVAPPGSQLAAYSKNEPGNKPEELTAENLGSWIDTFFNLNENLAFEGGKVSFGVAARNGLAQPWASGPKPWVNLADNSALFGTVSWNGALWGVTPFAEIVAGGARLTVELATLDGQLDFTNMEKWGANEEPGIVGSGTMWGNGDLGYTIEISENTFVQTGGDEGQITGVFIGPAHEAMGGVLERADLAAGFGGKR